MLEACRLLTPGDVALVISGLPGRLPLFNPDLENAPPEVVEAFRTQIASCDALLLASPEYAHGVSAVLKNTLEWLVSHPAATGTPVVVVNARVGSSHADAALRDVLGTMGVHLVGEGSTCLPSFPGDLSPAEIAAHPELGPRLRRALEELAAEVPDYVGPGVRIPTVAPPAGDAGGE